MVADRKRAEHVGTDVGDDPGRGVTRGLRGFRRAEPAAVKRDAQRAAPRQERLSEVRFPGAQRARAPKKEQPVSGRGAQRKHRLTRPDVDEDLVPGRRSQRRAPLAQGIGHANQPHGVDRVDGECGVRRLERIQPGERVTNRIRIPARIRAQRVRQIAVRVQTRPGTPVLFELDEDRPL